MPSEIYQIRVHGELNENWSDWFEGMQIDYGGPAGGMPTTTLTGAVADQSALRGILTKIWNLNLIVISVNRIDTES